MQFPQDFARTRFRCQEKDASESLRQLGLEGRQGYAWAYTQLINIIAILFIYLLCMGVYTTDKYHCFFIYLPAVHGLTVTHN